MTGGYGGMIYVRFTPESGHFNNINGVATRSTMLRSRGCHFQRTRTFQLCDSGSHRQFLVCTLGVVRGHLRSLVTKPDHDFPLGAACLGNRVASVLTKAVD